MNILTSWWFHFQTWRTNRLLRKLTYASINLMLQLAEDRLRGPLTRVEAIDLVRRYSAWMTSDEDRMAQLLQADKAVRLLHLFLSEVIQ